MGLKFWITIVFLLPVIAELVWIYLSLIANRPKENCWFPLCGSYFYNIIISPEKFSKCECKQLALSLVPSNGSYPVEPIKREKKYCQNPLTLFASLLTSKYVQKKNPKDTRNLNTENIIVSEVLLKSKRWPYVCGSKSYTQRMMEY